MIAIAITDELVKQTIEKFWEAVPPVWNVVKAHIRETASRDFDITVEQFHILRHVHKGVDCISDLAEVKHISRPAISQAVDTLVNKGLLTRTQDSKDRRYVQLALTAEGESLLAAIFDNSRLWMGEKFATLPEDDLRNLMNALDSLKHAMIPFVIG